MPERPAAPGPRDLAVWRALCEHIEAQGQPAVRTDDVDERWRWLLATPLHWSYGCFGQEEAGEVVVCTVGAPCGLTQRQAREVQRVRREYGLVVWGLAGDGWSLRPPAPLTGCDGWRERLAELEAAALEQRAG